MRMLRLGLSVAALATTLAIAQAEAPPPRTALVIGNADYSFAPLRNPINDADAVAKSLEEAGFNVILAKNAGHAELEKAVKELGQELKSKGGVGLFYFSGHGAQIEGENYLIPAGNEIADFDDVKTKSLTGTEIVDAMSAAKNDLNIIILDACRNNPIDPNGSKGLSRIDSSASLFVSFATSPGAVALDGAGNNSPYTKYLATSIAEPNLNIEETFKRTLKGVYVDTHGEQTPWISSTYFGEFVFRPTDAGAAPAPGKTEAVAESDAPAQSDVPVDIRSKLQSALLSLSRPSDTTEDGTPDLAGIYRVSGTNPNGSKYRGMVALTQDKDQFDFTWWIGKQVFHGTGQFAGRMLVVNWGDTKPVIYSFTKDGTLDGEWADGSGGETLEPVASAAADEVDLAEGAYDVEGRNPDGKSYKGKVEIEKDGDKYHVSWNVGDSAYDGTGTLEGNLLTVEWGSATPVVYALADDGSLKGLWDAGLGEETLTPDE
jgi:hypothetical protein